MASIEDFIAADYAENYAEAHRRRPSHFVGPMLTACVALYHPPQFRETFRPYLAAVLDFIGHKKAAEYAQQVFARLEYPQDGQSPLEPHPAPNFIVETRCDSGFDNAMWRLEIHRDYLALTLFVGMHVESDETGGYLALALSSDVEAHAAVKIHPSAAAHEKVFATLFGRFFDRVEAAFNPLFEDLNGFYGAMEAVLDIGRLKRAFPGGQSMSAADVIHRSGRRLFFHAYGVVVPWNIVGYGLAPEDFPVFPARATTGFNTPAEIGPAASRTDRFLKAIWKQGIAAHMLAPPGGGAPTSGGAGGADTVACFVQRGHGLYVSSLGHRSSPQDHSPLKYLLMYSDAPDGRDSRARPDRSWGVPKSVVAREIRPDRTQYSWRLSRLIGRLHDLGIARLAALRSQESIVTFAQQLRAVEQELNLHLSIGRDRLNAIQRKLQGYALAMQEPIVARSARARYYMHLVSTLSQDLDVITLPSYQPYDHFVRRRLFSQIEYLSSIGPRYERLLERIRAINEYESSNEILKIQQLADVVAAVILVFYSMEIVEHAGSAIYRGRHWFLAFRQHDYDLASTPHSFNGLITVATLAVALVVYFIVAERVWRIVWNWWGPPAKKAGDPVRPMPIIGASVFLWPYLLVSTLARAGRSLLKAVMRMA